MASNIIFTLQSKADKTGLDQTSAGFEKVKQQMQDTAKSASSVGISLGTLKQNLAGGVIGTAILGSFANFTKEAIQSEEVTARFGMQLKAFGQTIDSVDMVGLTKKAHDFGITQTEMVSTLGKSLAYFHSVGKEMALLDTAMGMAKFSGNSLDTTFRQLGYVLQYGVGRAVRQYGVSMHTEIHDPTQRGIAISEELTKKFASMAAGTGTTAEGFKKLGANIKDMGETLASGLVPIIGTVVKALNSLFEDTGKKSKLTGFLPTDLISSFIDFIKLIKSTKDAQEEADKAQNRNITTYRNAVRARASDYESVIGQEEKFSEVVTRNTNLLQSLYLKEIMLRKGTESTPARSDLADTIKAQAEGLKIKLEGQQKESDEMSKHNITNLDQYKKFQYKMEELRIMTIKEGNEKDLAEFALKMTKEKDIMTQAYGNELDVRLAMTQAEASQETEVRKKQIDEEMSYALLSKEEQSKYDQDYANAKMSLAGMTSEGLKQADDATKALVKDTEGGQKALKEWTDEEARRQEVMAKGGVYSQEDYRRKYKELFDVEKKAKDTGLQFFSQEEKTANVGIKLTPTVNITVTPNSKEIAKEISQNSQNVFDKWVNEVANTAQTHNVA